MKLAVTFLTFSVAALLSLGMVMLYSSSMTQVGAHYLVKQLIWGAFGFLGCLAAAALDYRVLKKLTWLVFGLSVVLLAIVLVPHVGQDDGGFRAIKAGGARRWLGFGPARFQPSELGKLALILAMAWYGERFQRQMPTFKKGILVPSIFSGLILGLIFVEPDRGTTILLAAVIAGMLLIAGVKWKYFVPPIVTGAALIAVSLWNDPMRMRRIFSWLYLEEHKSGPGYQAYQAMLALGSGGWFGLGLGNGRQKQGFVPEHHTDFILSIIGEELGLIATLLVVAAFVVLVLCGIYIAYRARDTFGLLLGFGITLLIGLQAAINIGVVTSALPNKGLPLPFISYGGSNLLLMMTCVGLLLSIARHGRPTEDFADAPVPTGEMQTA